jgi:tRNA(fMet)-specific endonuclease VapC
VNGDYAWDTNILIGYFNFDVDIHAKIKTANEISIPIAALGEVYYGAFKSGRSRTNIERINEFRDHSCILACNAETATLFGTIKNSLRLKGKLIPANDIWIAASAMQHNLILVTRDAHFCAVDGLTIEAW